MREGRPAGRTVAPPFFCLQLKNGMIIANFAAKVRILLGMLTQIKYERSGTEKSSEKWQKTC